MKFYILLLFIISTALMAKEKSSFEFLKSEAVKSNKNYTYNQYENIINGSVAFVIGNVGYFTTPSQSLKLAYSGVQTIGILNVGKGIYDYYRPIQDKELYLFLNKTKNLDKNTMAKDIIKIFADEQRAKRMQLLWGSSLLATQYFINAYADNTQKELKEIYQFLGGVNLIVVGYAYFYKQKYEKFYYEDRLSFMPSPILYYDQAAHRYAQGIGINFNF